MAAPRVSANMPLYDPSKSSLAFGNRALPKLNRELQSSDVAVRQQALLLLADVLHKRENLVTALKEGIPTSLKQLLPDKNATVRQRSAHALGIIAQHALGRVAFLENGLLPALSQLVRANGLLEAGLIPLCVEKLGQETDTDLKDVILATLHWCFQVETSQGLAANTIQLCASLLKHKDASVRSKAAQVTFDLSLPLEGKEVCYSCACIPPLMELLCDEDSDTRAQATASLMSIAVITKAKHAMVEQGAIPLLTAQLQHSSSEVRLNTIKALTLLAETPKGKGELRAQLEKLKDLANTDTSDMVRKAATRAVEVVTWTP
ncbi:hypothetical protein EMCRGX_G023731 [Ephydatia muelleri]